MHNMYIICTFNVPPAARMGWMMLRFMTEAEPGVHACTQGLVCSLQAAGRSCIASAKIEVLLARFSSSYGLHWASKHANFEDHLGLEKVFCGIA